MITPLIFTRNDRARQQLADAMSILDVAFAAAEYEENERTLATKHDPMECAIALGKRKGRIELMAQFHAFAQRPAENVESLEANANTIDPLDAIGLEAERKYAEQQASKNPVTKTK